MDVRLLNYYNQELRYLREMGSEFSREFPKIAARLGMEGLEVTDPYVERLLAGCAFLAARVQLKQDAEFPRFSQRLLELVYPNLLAPIPSMMVIQATPVPDANLLKPGLVPRDTRVLGPRSAISETRCEFRTGDALQLTPLATSAADYLLNMADLGLSSFKLAQRPRSAVRVQLRLPAGMSINQLDLDHLRFYLGGATETSMQLHELLHASCVGVLVGMPGRGEDGRRQLLPPSAVVPVGYGDNEALLPVNLQGFSGLRVLQEHFSFPERFLFFDLLGLKPVLRGLSGSSVEIAFLFARPGTGLDGAVSVSNFLLHCAPAINLFPKRADHLHLESTEHEFHVVPERTAALDYEVYDVASLQGLDDAGTEHKFLPLYTPTHAVPARHASYFSLWREPRLASTTVRRDGPRSGYIGSEVFVSLVDQQDAPYAENLRQLGAQLRCTNRDLPLFMPGGGALAEFSMDCGRPLQSVRAVAGPTRPHSALREGGVAWRMLNLLSLNYLSLLDTDTSEAAAVLRDLLSRLPQGSDAGVRQQIESLQQVQARPVVRRHPVPGPIAFGRGVEIQLTVDEMGHTGASAFLFGAAMHHYLARHVSLNSFVETVLVSTTRGEIMRWAPHRGTRPVL